MTVEPVASQNIIIAAMAGALIVLFGAVYALFFAWSRIHDRPRLMIVAYGAYAVLFAATLVLVRTLNLEGFWQVVAIVMVVGYLLAPQAIWHLCVGTHTGHSDNDTKNTLAVGGEREETP